MLSGWAELRTVCSSKQKLGHSWHLQMRHTHNLTFITPSPLMEVGVPAPSNHKQLSGLHASDWSSGCFGSKCKSIHPSSQKLKSKNTPMKVHKKQIDNKSSPKGPNTKCLLHQRWNVYPERRMSRKAGRSPTKTPHWKSWQGVPAHGDVSG